MPSFASAALEPGDYVDVTPTEWRSDGVVALSDDKGQRTMAIVVEVQRGRPPIVRRRPCWISGRDWLV